jgi:hypothetical protein
MFFLYQADDVPEGANVAGHLLPDHDELVERYNSGHEASCRGQAPPANVEYE